MNYKLHYEKLISKAQNRSILKSEYKENHHIKPSCIGGLDIKENMVNLFPEEHIIAHLLLVKIYPLEEGLVYAANMMSNGCSHKNLNRPKNNNKKYAWLKKKHSILMSNRIISEEQKAAQSKFWKENNPMFSQEVRDKVSKANIGKIHTQITKDKISESKKGNAPWNKGKECPSLTGENNSFYGKSHTAESKKQISETKKDEWNNKSEDEKKAWAKRFGKKYKVTSPDGEVFICIGLKGFANDYNLSYKALFESTKRKKPISQGSSKGWYAIKED